MVNLCKRDVVYSLSLSCASASSAKSKSVTQVTPMATRAFSRLKNPIFSSILIRNLTRISIIHHSLPLIPKVPSLEPDYCKPICGFRLYYDGRPRGPLWKGKKLIGKEALFVILGLKRFKDDEEMLHKFIKTHVLRLLKMELILYELHVGVSVELTLQSALQSSIYDLT